MSKNKRATTYLSILVVHVGSASALIDMLRYDRCCPLTEEESGKIERLMNHRADPKDHLIRLIRFSSHNRGAEVDRWRSFGCTVLDERSPDASQLSDDELMKMASPGARIAKR